MSLGFYKGSPLHPFAGGPHIMGIVNVTPDSFSDGGHFLSPDKAIEHGLALVQAGATILDVGGESTRPGAQAIDVNEEIRRIIPVIQGLSGAAPWISVDTRNAKTMQAALKAGANSINDISALTHDSQSVFVASEAKIPVFFMHSQGIPESMQKNPMYNNVVKDILEYLKQRIDFFDTNGIDANMLVCDPGIGFGKTLEHNCLILRNIERFHDLGVPVLLGTSRKSFIAWLSKGEPPEQRISGSIASALWGLSQGVQVFRVHDVRETVQAFKVFEAIYSDS